MNNFSFWTNKRVLITGHNGFKGSWLSLWLSDLGASVYGLSLENNNPNSIYNLLDLRSALKGDVTIDIRDFQCLLAYVQELKFDVVFHLAAQPLVRESYKNPLDTWSTNVQGSLNLLESLKHYNHNCAVVMITTDKVYLNRELPYAYHETDRLGGHDPYSASKAACELAINSWRLSYCSPEKPSHNLLIATARAGNVIGGGDCAHDRIFPDIVRSITNQTSLHLRNPYAVRPWQHVLEPLSGYMLLAQKLYTEGHNYAQAYNFGPLSSNHSTVLNLVRAASESWPANIDISVESSDLHEASLLSLQITKAVHELNWSPLWSFDKTVEQSINWYKAVHQGEDPLATTRKNIESYCSAN